MPPSLEIQGRQPPINPVYKPLVRCRDPEIEHFELQSRWLVTISQAVTWKEIHR